MKLTNQDLLNSIPTLRELSKEQLPIKVSYVISKNIKNIEEELVVYEEERQKLLKQYAELDKEGKPKINDKGHYVIKNEKQADFNKGVLELLDIETDVNISKINLNALEGLKISPLELTSIDFMIKE
ncbi:hypothetical protein [Anaerosalibacter massiliensis]|uniref:hypothetical protein n=1 Tax=Anaerosalibacter massiliensis TaxID=1347392 RepID=UPI0005B2E530|nr:hypothetical protein [Anaerosalibacter massiliensis]